MCASSGNTNGAILFPASDHRVIACGASTRTDQRAQFSSFGVQLSVVAPGVDVPTTVIHGTSGAGGVFGKDYTGTTPGSNSTGFTGTSASAPHVAGLAALILSVRPDLT